MTCLQTHVITPNGFDAIITLPITTVADISRIDAELHAARIRPYTEISFPTVLVGTHRDAATNFAPSDGTPDDGDPASNQPDLVGTPFLASTPDDPHSSDDENSPSPSTERGSGGEVNDDAPTSRRPSAFPQIVEITRFTVEAIANGGNKGEPYWRAHIGDDERVNMFDLDVLIRDSYLTRAEAMNGWRTIGSVFTVDPPLPATISKNGRYWEITAVRPPREHQLRVRPPKPVILPFRPDQVVEIADIAPTGDTWIGKSNDLVEITIAKKQHEHIAAAGHDTATWNHAEPYVRVPIPVVLENGWIRYVRSIDGVWTQAITPAQAKHGSVLCLRCDDALIYRTVNAVRRLLGVTWEISFQDDDPPVTTQSHLYLALNPQETVSYEPETL